MEFPQSQSLVLTPESALRVPPLSELEQGLGSEDSQAVSPSKVYLSLIIPTYNEGKNIQRIISILTDLLKSIIPGSYELIVVDDNSPDQTWEIAESLTHEYPHLKVMRREKERGLATAVIRGWQVSSGEVLGVIDGDLQHPPEVLLNLLSEMELGADLAVASRHVEGGGVSSWSLTRRFLSRGAQILGLILLPGAVGRVSDPMSGYFMVRRSSIADQVLSPTGYKILLEVIGRGQINKIAEVGYVFREREAGESKVTWKQYINYLHHLVRLRVSTGRLGRLRRRIDFPIKRFISYGLIGFSGVFVDMAVFYLLRTSLNLPVGRSTILSAEVAVINNFLWNDIWTFGDFSRTQPGRRQRLIRFLKFNVICLMGIILQALLVSFMYDFLGLNEFVAKLIAIAMVTLWNFWINLKLNWRVTALK
jgi:dolichol-phosphate mannosyltransferase